MLQRNHIFVTVIVIVEVTKSSFNISLHNFILIVKLVVDVTLLISCTSRENLFNLPENDYMHIPIHSPVVILLSSKFKY
jgi:hypothetical protein